MLHLLIVNGWSANSGFWTDFEQGLTNDFTLQVIDLNQALSADEHLEIIDQNVRPNTLLLGWSLGGTLVAQYAASHHHRPILGLMTIQTNPCFVAQENWPFGISEDVFKSLYELVLNGDMKTLHRHFSHLLVKGSHQHKLDRAFLKNVYQQSSLAPPAVLLSGLNLLSALDVRECLKIIDIPCLHVFGGKDELVSSKVMPAVQKLNPKHKCKVIADMAHLPTGTYCSPLQGFINEFVNENFYAKGAK